MPIFLSAPVREPSGPDGQGWNRLTAAAPGPSAQCALRPRSHAALVESQDTRRARWGAFGPCTRAGNCAGCPIASAAPRRLRSFTRDVLVRFLPRGGRTELHLMNNPAKGWDSSSSVWTWDELARLQGWRIGHAHRDEHGEGFWLHAAHPPQGGKYGHR